MRLSRILFLLFTASTLACAEDLASSSFEKHHWVLEAWTAGGKGLSGTTKDTGLWTTGVRIGKQLNRSLEYDVEVVPAFMVFQDSTAVYGINLTPALVKWNIRTKGKIVPYLEWGAGLLFTASDVPDGTSSFNFTPQAGVGLQIFSREKRAVRIGFRYMHISNGGLNRPNPGINTLQLMVGYEWFR